MDAIELKEANNALEHRPNGVTILDGIYELGFRQHVICCSLLVYA